MSVEAFFTDEARTRTAKAVGACEAHTSAEVVVTVRQTSGPYRGAWALGGFVAGLLALCVLLFSPTEFDWRFFPVDVLVAFLLGAVVTARTAPLTRLFAGRKTLERAVDRASRAAFYDQGISGTRDRTGILVYVTLVEKRVVLLPDLGVDTEQVEGWADFESKLAAAVHGKDLEAFLSTVEAMGPALADSLPRAEDDVNELPDAVTL